MSSGAAYMIVLSVIFGLSGGIIGRIKGGSFLIWFLICFCLWIIGVIVALLYRWEKNEPRRLCPGCNSVLLITDAICSRCGQELDYPDQIVPSQLAQEERARRPA